MLSGSNAQSRWLVSTELFIWRLGARPLCDGPEHSVAGSACHGELKESSSGVEGKPPYGWGSRPVRIRLEQAGNLHSPHWTMAVRVGPVQGPSQRRPHISTGLVRLRGQHLQGNEAAEPG